MNAHHLTSNIYLACLIAISLSTTAQPTRAQVTSDQIEAAANVKELLALGANKMTAADFKAKIVGKKMSGDGWTWIIAKDGTTSSASTDGSWKEDNAPWSMKGDKYCAPLQGQVKCRDVYILGKYMRMSDKGNAKKLSSWMVTLK